MTNKHNKRKNIIKIVSALMVALISILALSVPCLALVSAGQSDYQGINSTFPLTIGFAYDNLCGASSTTGKDLPDAYIHSVDLGGFGNNYGKAVSGTDTFDYTLRVSDGFDFPISNKVDYYVDKVVYPESARLYVNDNDYISRGFRSYELTPYSLIDAGVKGNMLQRYDFYADDIYINTALLDGKYSPNGSYVEYGIPFIELGGDFIYDSRFRALYDYEYSFDLCTSAGGYHYDFTDTWEDIAFDSSSVDTIIPLIDRNFLLECIPDDSEIIRIENFVGKLRVSFYEPIASELPALGAYTMPSINYYSFSENASYNCRIGISAQPLNDYESAEIKVTRISTTLDSGAILGDVEGCGNGLEIIHGMGGLGGHLDLFYPGFTSNDTYYIYVDYVEEAGIEAVDNWLTNGSGDVIKTIKKYDYSIISDWELAVLDQNSTLGNDYSRINICLPFYNTATCSGAWGSSIYKELFAYPNAERFWRFSSEFWHNSNEGDNDDSSGGAGPGGGANGGGFGDGDYPSGWEDMNTDLVGWLGTAVGGFMSAEIFPGFTLGGVLGILVSFSLVLVLLKYLGG